MMTGAPGDGPAMTAARWASDDEVRTWRDDGWVVLESLVAPEEIAAAVADLHEVLPTAEQYHADPARAVEGRGTEPRAPGRSFTWPATGPGFRPEQHRWNALFPFPGTGALNRLCVHRSVVDFVQRVLGTTDVRIYQAQVSGKYTGETNYEQPMHTDRNHSWLPPRSEAPWWHVEMFLYLSDVGEATAPTHLVRVGDSRGRPATAPLVMPGSDPELYAAERPATGPRGSLLAYRPDVFHRAVDLHAPAGARFLLNVSYKVAGQDWIGYHSMQSRATSEHWVAFVEGSTARELELFGFPPPGHPVWTGPLLDATAGRYPGLDLGPWRAALPAR